MAGRKKKNNNNKRRPGKPGSRRLTRYRGSASLNVIRSSSIVNYMKIIRTVLAALPIITGTNKSITSLIGLFDVSFNFIKNTLSGSTFYNGAYAIFMIRAGSLMMNSPLMAQNSTKLSFPGYPISTRWIRFKLRNTSANSERSGRWAAVFIPFRETHDEEHYTAQLLNGITFEEAAAMPYARVADARKDLTINFTMRDKTMYCARPRELKEGLGIVLIVWDTGSRDDFSSQVTNSMFNCEIDLEAGCLPHPIFGPKHRIDFVTKDIDIKSITDGTSALVIDHDNKTRYVKSIEPEDVSDGFEQLTM